MAKLNDECGRESELSLVMLLLIVPLFHSHRNKHDVQQLQTDLAKLPPPSASEPTSPILLDSSSSSVQDGRAVSFASGSGSDVTRSETVSSTGSGEGEKKLKHGHSLSIGHLSRGSSSHSASLKSHKSSGPPPFVLPARLTPLGLVQFSLETILTIPGYPLDELRNEIMPQLYHAAYSHRVNCRETDLDGVLALVKMFRGRSSALRIRFKSHLIDMDGTATMEQAAVGLSYDIIATPHHHGRGKHEIEEKRTSAMCIAKIFQSRIAQMDVVIDTEPFHEKESKEVACVVM